MPRFLKILFWVLIYQPNFVIQCEASQAKAVMGKVPARFLSDCEDILQAFEIHTGYILGLKKSRGMVFQFKDIPATSHQAFRNAWTLQD